MKQNKFISNSFQIPNAVIDEYLATISCNAFKCYIFIVRKTRGWQKTTDSISISQFEEFLNISDKTVRKALKELSNLDLIRRREVVGKPTLISLVEHPNPTVLPLPKNGRGNNMEGVNIGKGTPTKSFHPQKSSKKEEEEESCFIKNLDNFISFLKVENNLQINNKLSFKNTLINNHKNQELKTITNYNAYLQSHYYISDYVINKFYKDMQITSTEIDKDDLLCLHFKKENRIVKVPSEQYSSLLKIVTEQGV